MSHPIRLTGRLLPLALALFVGTVGIAGADSDKLWPVAGQDLHNTRFQDKDGQLKRQHLEHLKVKWVFETNSYISATATLDKDFVYIPDWDQFIYKIRREDGTLEWRASIGDFTGLPGNLTRNSPVLYENYVLAGGMGGLAARGAKFMAIDRETGELIWITKVEDHPSAFITQSPVVHNDVVYVGVSSLETLFATFPGYPCCSFRGSLMALDVHTGDILWKTYFTPEPPVGWDPAVNGPWYSGTAVWGSTTVIDEVRGRLYVNTSQNYSVPQSVLSCVATAQQNGDDALLCNDPRNYFDSMLALDMETGEILWGEPKLEYDAWTIACLFGNASNCPDPKGPDWDFGQGPSLFVTSSGQQLLGAGQKSGVYWALDPDTGETVWSTEVGPGGLAGGMQWGSAVDGERVYVAAANSDFKLWNLVNPAPDSVASTFGGGWSALDAETGDILWQTADPSNFTAWSPVAVNKHGLVFACSMDNQGHMYILDAETGERLWSFASGGSCVTGATVVDKEVYWGSGYIGPGRGVFNNKFYAFSYQPPEDED